MNDPKTPLSTALRSWVAEERDALDAVSPEREELVAYFEGRLDSQRRDEIRRLLVLDPEISARYREVLAESTDRERRRLTRVLETASTRRRLSPSIRRLAVAAAFALGIAVAWFVPREPRAILEPAPRIVELESTRRAGTSTSTVPLLDREERPVVLTLSVVRPVRPRASSRAVEVYDVTLESEAEEIVERRSVERTPEGTLRLTIRPSSLEPGDYSLEVVDPARPDARLETYRFRVVEGAAATSP